MFGAGRYSIPRPVTRNLEDLDSVQSVLLHSIPPQRHPDNKIWPNGPKPDFEKPPLKPFFVH